MPRALAEVEPQAAVPQPTVSTAPGEAQKATENLWNLRGFTASLIKFRIPKRKKRNKVGAASSMSKAQELNENLERPCGLGFIVIRSCQRFNTVSCFLFFYCILSMSQGLVFGLVDLSIDLFWRGNILKTIESVVLSLSYDISSCLVVPFISYYGGKGNIPKWIMASSFLVGFGSLLCAFPFYYGKKYQLNIETEDICEQMKISRVCKESIFSQSKFAVFFMLGQIVQGIAGMPLYVLGVCFLYDNVATHSAGTFLGLAEASVTVGYALGYTVTAPLIKISETSTFDKSIGDRDNNQHWLQTWWIRFVFASVIAWSTLIPLSFFPHHIQGTTRIKAGKQNMPHLLDRKYKDQEFGTSIKDLFASTWILIKTPIFVCLALVSASESLLMVATSEYLPIYIQNQFIETPSTAIILSGLVLIPGAAIGQLLGGIIVSKLHMHYKGLMIFTIVTSVVSLVLIVFVFVLRCNLVPFAGINENYDGTGQLGNLTAPCNLHCKCSSSFYFPVCGRDDTVYLSPCFAGCTYSKTLNNRKTYFNCSCIKKGLTTSDVQGDFIDARPGSCDAKCYKLPLFIVFTFSSVIFAYCSSVPNILTILRLIGVTLVNNDVLMIACLFACRIVPDKQRFLAVGITYVILRVFGSIPGPIVFKMAGEHSCAFWNNVYCGKTRNCWIYNMTKMAYLFIGIWFSCKSFTILFTALAFGLYKYLLRKNSEVLLIPVKNIKIKKKERTDL